MSAKDSHPENNSAILNVEGRVVKGKALVVCGKAEKPVNAMNSPISLLVIIIGLRNPVCDPLEIIEVQSGA